SRRPSHRGRESPRRRRAAHDLISSAFCALCASTRRRQSLSACSRALSGGSSRRGLGPGLTTCGGLFPIAFALLNPGSIASGQSGVLATRGRRLRYENGKTNDSTRPRPVLKASAVTGDKEPSNTAFPCLSQR